MLVFLADLLQSLLQSLVAQEVLCEPRRLELLRPVLQQLPEFHAPCACTCSCQTMECAI